MQRTKTWICGACGRTVDHPTKFRDVSCALNCVQIYEDSLKRDVEVNGNKYGIYVEDGGVVDPQPDWDA